MILKVKDIIKKYVIDPEWQRNCNIWSNRTIETYIKDILDGRPMPPILALQSKTAGNVVIDGKQRICTLMDALDNSDFTMDEKKQIRNYEYNVDHYSDNLFKKDSSDIIDTQKIVDFFYKTNSLGTRPNGQEIRRALHYNRPYIKYVKKEKTSARFKKFLDQFGLADHVVNQIGLRFMDEEFILKTLAFYYTQDFNKSPYTNKIIDQVVSKKSQKNLEESMQTVLEMFAALYDDSDLPKQINFLRKYKGVMPIILGLLSQYEVEDIHKHRHKIGEFLNHFWFMRHDEIAQRFDFTFNSGSGFYRAVVMLIVDKMDGL